MWFGARLVFKSVHTGAPEALAAGEQPHEI